MSADDRVLGGALDIATELVAEARAIMNDWTYDKVTSAQAYDKLNRLLLPAAAEYQSRLQEAPERQADARSSQRPTALERARDAVARTHVLAAQAHALISIAESLEKLAKAR